MVAAQAAMTEIMRARVQSGIAAGDPLNPLIVALANIIAVLGKMPAAVARQQQAITDASQDIADTAQARLEQTLGETVQDLVGRLGVTIHERERWKWLAICVVSGGLLLTGVYAAAYQMAYANARAEASLKIAASKEAFDNQIKQVQAEADQKVASSQLEANKLIQLAKEKIIPETLAWARSILTPPSSLDGAPFPCATWGEQQGLKLGGKEIITCSIALRFKPKDQAK